MFMRRSHEEMTRSVLDALRQFNEPVKPTHIMYRTRLNYSRMKAILGDLVREGLVAVDRGLYSATTAGHDAVARRVAGDGT